MSDKLQVNVFDTDSKAIVILEGEAAAPINKKGYKIDGCITAVVDFLSKRASTVDPLTSHIEVNTEAGTIVLIADADSPLSVIVTASLKQPSHLAKFDIQGGSTKGLKEMGEMLRTHRFLFADTTEYDTLVSHMLNFKARVETDIEQSRNTSNSSSKRLHDKTVKVDQRLFKVKTPLFVGGEDKTFTVELCCDVTDGSAIFWLESLDYIEMTRAERERLLKEQITALRDKEYAIILK